MIKLYFRPLQDESFLSKTEVLSLFGNIQDIYSFQQEFLQSLEEAVEGDLESMNSCSQLKVRNIIRQNIWGVGSWYFILDIFSNWWLFLLYFRTCYCQLLAPLSITQTTLSCIAYFVLVIPRLKKLCIQVSRDKMCTESIVIKLSKRNKIQHRKNG